MLLCTQLAPARHVIQVGENNISRRGCPASRLKSDFNTEILVSEITLPLCPALAGRWPEVAEVQDVSTRITASVAAMARAERRPSWRQHRMTRMTLVPSACSSMPFG
jgi:hypothetical protein